ncbi:MAG TPA: redoxin domain-containing protein [Terriglobia bacterium]|nr:redoxin domain-containing protein [Terriglobia bacterium]
MKHASVLMGLTLGALLAAPSVWAARVGNPAPDFNATDSTGKVQKLSEYRGKYVVLEWHNRECPYTHKHYVSGNMQKLQRDWTSKGVIWFTVISSAPGQQGYMTAAEENAYVEKMQASPTAVLLDPAGALGHLYAAKTTPQMLIINPQGILIYDGAIDSKPTTEVEDIASAENYVNLALKEAMAGEQVKIPVTRPYGCSVKYAH